MKLSRYILATDPGMGRTDIVVSTEFPFAVGSAYFVDQNDSEAIDNMNLQAVNGKTAKCLGHSVYMTLSSVLSGEELSAEDVTRILGEMADFFKTERLDKKPGKYRKYCENPKEIPSKEIREHFISLRHRRKQ